MMQMSFKPDWEQAAKRFEAWWAGEIIDRVCLQVVAPKENVTRKHVPAPTTLEERWTNVEYVVTAAEERMRCTFYGGEAFPCFYPNLGPDVFAACLGCPLVFGETTSWSMPIVEDWDRTPLVFDFNCRWWRLIREMTELALEVGAGKFFVGLTDLHGGTDAVAALRDPQQWCLDLVERPDKIKAAMAKVTPMWFDVYEDCYRLIQRKMQGSATWLNVWSPGRWYPVSCDYICLISTPMVREFVLPDIAAQVEWLDHSLFHLDGPGAIPHLDLLLEMPKLGGIQWVPGAGSPPMLEWIPLLKQIQAAGKLLHLSVSANEVEPLLRELSPKGLMLSTWVRSEDEARAMLKDVEKWTKN